MRSDQSYLTLSPDCSLRLLERPCAYNRARDELYELDAEAAEFIQRLPIPVDGENTSGRPEAEFVDYCLSEGILDRVRERSPRRVAKQAPTPSLRYLLIHITTRCNLTCAHCYLGDVKPADLSLDSIVRAIEEFDNMQGLRLLVSGGEPLMHPQFWELNELFPKFSFRTVILSNGTLFGNPDNVTRLRAHEVQVSLDGVGISHDSIRGAGSYEKSLNGLHELVHAGIDISIATMVHAGNQDDFEELETVVHDLGAREWNIDVPARTGRWAHANSADVSPEKTCSILERAFGGGSHYSGEDDWTCGAHLCAVTADGAVCKCGFYADSPIGFLDDGLANCWVRMPRLRIGDLRCDCDLLSDCRGGCRYRAQLAGDRFGKDPVMCAANGLPC